ncbi:MAG TPA: IPT/TIG domain-containing protein [Bryobacteraceae bacterium]|nr:IPT/TIG domain-containing protein [Bryobacteraceae bacterium]
MTAISPASGAIGASVDVTLTGANFVAGANVAVSDPNITVSGATVVGATQITVTLTIAPSDTPGTASVTVATVGGTSAPVSFAVRQVPVITWSNPADIVFSSALGDDQLNATANVPGTFTTRGTLASGRKVAGAAFG